MSRNQNDSINNEGRVAFHRHLIFLIPRISGGIWTSSFVMGQHYMPIVSGKYSEYSVKNEELALLSSESSRMIITMTTMLRDKSIRLKAEFWPAIRGAKTYNFSCPNLTYSTNQEKQIYVYLSISSVLPKHGGDSDQVPFGEHVIMEVLPISVV